MKILSILIPGALLALGLTQTTCQHEGPRPSLAGPADLVAPVPTPATQPTTPTSSVMVYIKVVVDKKYGVMARLVGGMHDNIWERIHYDEHNPWWLNPLIVHAEPLLTQPDLTVAVDAPAITGEGSSANISVKLTLVPHADIAVKTTPRSDGVKGVITTTISTLSEYYDGHWTQMAREIDRPVSFAIDTCDPREQLEEISRETRVIPTIAFERYTRNQEKWDAKYDWPQVGKRGDWSVVIYGKEATLTLVSYRYVKHTARLNPASGENPDGNQP